MKPLVIYHAGCWDGFCAAWVARKALGPCDFVPLNYGEDLPQMAGRNVYVLDFSFPRQAMIECHAMAASFLVFDHHKTARDALEGLPFCTFDMNKSGGRLAWEHFFPGVIRPWLVDYTEDRDLWLWKLPHSQEINAALRSYPLDFNTWDQLEEADGSKAFDRLKDEGRAILRAQQQLVEQHVANAIETKIDGHLVLMVNATCHVSEIAGALAKGRPFGLVWFEGDQGERVYSLRSDANGLDVSEIAKRFGGGGHARAAGFRVAATGATGLFTEGQLPSDDEGELKIALSTDKRNRLVRIDFGKQVSWLGIPKQNAMELSSIIAKKAAEL